MTTAYVKWPPSESDPYTDAAGAKRSRLRIIIQTAIDDHPVRPLFGIPSPDTFFETVTVALEASLRVAIRQAVGRYEPGVFIPSGRDGVAIIEKEIDGRIVRELVINYRDVDEPDVIPDPIVERLRSG
jgi:phage baseplate assembly protein W